ncbi:hypothetical protein H6G00_34315 [Leptolyngbya sp. FACHB-541]|uniref:glycosyl hydrolase n=1 Tax=Leptolyngbya sp. FACHB-541 TaxID=2692810 RepID=UPI0016853D5C|nr:glycosyl hydrolase [Leptolyngbya sp. FACHB-541]MBD2001605.1 hypothetical protein [Leptolyngbya sp. FACHB-541]
MIKRRVALGLLGGAIAGLSAQCRSSQPLVQKSLAQTVQSLSPTAEFLGLNVGTELNWTNWRDKLLPLYQSAGIRWLRVWYNWATLESVRGRYDSELTLESLQLAKNMGFKILFVVWGTPAFAGNGELSAVPNATDWVRYCNWLRSNMAGLVDAWEIGNEPNLDKYHQGSPASYVQLLSSANQVLRQSAPVIAAGPSGASTEEYWQALLDSGLEQHCDRVNIHPYRVRSDEVIEVVDRFLRRVNKPLWITELGRSTDDGGERLKAEFLTNVMPRLSQRAEKVFWYRSIQGEGLHPMSYGLIEADEDSGRVKTLPAYSAYNRYAQALTTNATQANLSQP